MHAAHRVAKNTGILYIRMAITVFISLYSTRVVLSALGVSDFGLFNLVGGIIAMLGFLNASMASATQRFMSFAQGAGDIDRVKRIFNMSAVLHLAIAFFILLVLEILGFFLFHGILNIAENRIAVAKLLFQFMVISTLFTVISVPYEAVITSHENMLFFTVLGVIEAVLKLGIAIYVLHSTFDHLIMYGILMVVLSLFLLILRGIYCHRKYSECEINIRKNYNRKLLGEMTGFAGWNFLGTSSSMLANYGQGIVINIFFGTVVNAAQGIAGQVNGQLAVFATTLVKALNPIIDKSEGAGNRALMLKATMMGSKVSFFLMMALSIPFLIEAPFILKIWLKNVPEYAVIFCRLLLIRNLIEQLFIPVVSAIGAEGNIKGYQIRASILTFFPLLLSYILFKLQYPPYALYMVFIIYSIFASSIILYYAWKNCQLSISEFFGSVIMRCFFSFGLIFVFSSIPVFLSEPGFIRLATVLLLSIVLFLIVVIFIGFTSDERLKIKEMRVLLSDKLGISKFVFKS